jgi:hypothetical protein
MRAYRSPLRLFAFGILGIFLLVGAVDVLVGHWISTAPENTEGVLTTRGLAQQRGDIVWGAAMAGVGAILVGGAVVELVRRRPMAVVSPDGMVLAIGSHETDVSIPWGDIEDVTSDTLIDPYDGSRREVLRLDLLEPGDVPHDPIGATWEGSALMVDAHDWTRSVTDVALAAQGALGHHKRVAEIMQMGPPSVEWLSEPDAGFTAAVPAVEAIDPPADDEAPPPSDPDPPHESEPADGTAPGSTVEAEPPGAVDDESGADTADPTAATAPEDTTFDEGDDDAVDGAASTGDHAEVGDGTGTGGTPGGVPPVVAAAIGAARFGGGANHAVASEDDVGDTETEPDVATDGSPA